MAADMSTWWVAEYLMSLPVKEELGGATGTVIFETLDQKRYGPLRTWPLLVQARFNLWFLDVIQYDDEPKFSEAAVHLLNLENVARKADPEGEEQGVEMLDEIQTGRLASAVMPPKNIVSLLEKPNKNLDRAMMQAIQKFVKKAKKALGPIVLARMSAKEPTPLPAPEPEPAPPARRSRKRAAAPPAPPAAAADDDDDDDDIVPLHDPAIEELRQKRQALREVGVEDPLNGVLKDAGEARPHRRPVRRQLNVAPPHIRESDEDEDVAAAEAVRMNKGKGKQKKKKENRKKFNARQSGASTERWDDDDDEIEDTPNAPAAVPKLPAGDIIKTPPREKPQGFGKRRKKIYWTEVEQRELCRLTLKLGEGSWVKILKAGWSTFGENDRSNVDLKDKYRNLKKEFTYDTDPRDKHGNLSVDGVRLIEGRLQLYADEGSKAFKTQE